MNDGPTSAISPKLIDWSGFRELAFFVVALVAVPRVKSPASHTIAIGANSRIDPDGENRNAAYPATPNSGT